MASDTPPDGTPPVKKNGVSRRSFLRAAAIAVPSAMAGYVGGCTVGEDRQKKPSQDEIERVYAEVHDFLHEKKREADESGKPLLIIVGDTHSDAGRNTLFVQMASINIAQEMGIRVFAPELDQRRMKKLFRDETNDEIANTPNFKYAIKTARKKNMSVIPIDTYLESRINDKSLTLEEVENTDDIFQRHVAERDAEMVRHASRFDKGAVVMIGDAHFRGLIESELQEKFTIAALTATQLDLRVKYLAPAVIEHKPVAEGLAYFRDSDKIHHIKIKGRIADSLPGTTEDMLKKAIEKLEGHKR